MGRIRYARLPETDREKKPREADKEEGDEMIKGDSEKGRERER